MKLIDKWLAKLVIRANVEIQKQAATDNIKYSNLPIEKSLSGGESYRFCLHRAMNGWVLEIRYTPLFDQSNKIATTLTSPPVVDTHTLIVVDSIEKVGDKLTEFLTVTALRR